MINEENLVENETRPDDHKDLPSQQMGTLPPNLHEIGLTRPSDVERMEAERGTDLRESMAKANEDVLGSQTSIIPDESKEAAVDPEAITDSTDKIQPNTDTNPAAKAQSEENAGGVSDEKAETAESLEKGNSREELEKRGKDAGLDVREFSNKKELAAAILKAEAA